LNLPNLYFGPSSILGGSSSTFVLSFPAGAALGGGAFLGSGFPSFPLTSSSTFG